jgi:hypothetical protein
MCQTMLAAVMMQHSLTLTSCNGIIYRPVPVTLIIHILTDMIHSFIAKQNQYGTDFSHLCHIIITIIIIYYALIRSLQG